MNKIKVTQPTFLINLDNPTEVSYELLYVYKENRGYIKNDV